jgi:hypothetical protein
VRNYIKLDAARPQKFCVEVLFLLGATFDGYSPLDTWQTLFACLVRNVQCSLAYKKRNSSRED